MENTIIPISKEKFLSIFWEMGEYEQIERRFETEKKAEQFILECIQDSNKEYGYYICEIIKEGRKI